MKVYTRAQIRTAFKSWEAEGVFSIKVIDAVDDFLTYLDTYQFKGDDMADRATGRIKWYNVKKGYGFIKPDDGGEDVFVHHSDLNGIHSFKEDERVEFEIIKGARGIKAINLVQL